MKQEIDYELGCSEHDFRKHCDHPLCDTLVCRKCGKRKFTDEKK